MVRILEQIERTARFRDRYLSVRYILWKRRRFPYRTTLDNGKTYQWHRPDRLTERIARQLAPAPDHVARLARDRDPDVVGNTHAYYLGDLGYLLRDEALQTRQRVRDASSETRDFEDGRRYAYYEIIDLMQQQAETFELPLVDLALDGLDPERDILAD